MAEERVEIVIAPDGTVATHFIGPIDAAKLDAAIGRSRH